MDTIKRDLTLRDLYYSPKTGYRSSEHLYELAQKEDPDITRHYVKKWLQGQHSYTKFKKFNNPRHYRHTFVRDLGEQVQVDLVIVQKHKSENKGYQYILMAIEILSRYAFAVPLKNRDGKTTKEALDIFLDRYKTRFYSFPKLMQFDEGGEFLNKDVKALLEKYEITYFSTSSVRKATVVERLNRTVKEKFLKLFEANQNHNWVDHLQDIIQNYNTQENRSIGMSPSDVTEDNKFTVFGKTLWTHYGERSPKV